MKPTKNRVFCMGSQRPKILFESKDKALNFIRFNKDEILEENSVAPKRAYFCKYCAGWHVSSKMQPLSKRGKIKRLITIAYDNMDNNRYSAAKRFLIYAKEQLTMVKETMQESPFDDNMTSSIKKATKKLITLTTTSTPKCNTSQMPINIDYNDLDNNRCEIEVVGITEDKENNGLIIDIHPKLLYQGGGKYYYALYGCRITPDELKRTNELNRFSQGDSNIVTLLLHKLYMVEVKSSDTLDQNKQYAGFEELFDGNIMYAKKYGMMLLILERTDKTGRAKYIKRSHLDYWIRLKNHNVHFYSGRCKKYVCYVTSEEIPKDTVIRLFRKHAVFK